MLVKNIKTGKKEKKEKYERKGWEDREVKGL
jgi:hypothetical protein